MLGPIAAALFAGGAPVAARELPPYLECVPYARAQSGIQIYGDAHTWWDQAAGRYDRGRTPRVGAVMAFRPHRNMELGHVAAVSRVVDARTVLLRHANWSPINGRRGQIEDDVMAIDVSPGNDWSEVKVWYAPLQALGTTPWPVHGFIYNRPGRGIAPATLGGPTRVAAAAQAVQAAPSASAPMRAAPSVMPALTATNARPSRAFASAFAGGFAAQPARGRPVAVARVATRPASAPAPAASRPSDPVAAAIALYDGR